MGGDKNYEIIKQNVNQSVTGRGEPNIIKQKIGLFGRSFTIPLAGAVLVSGACFAYAHHVWKKTDHSKEDVHLMAVKEEFAAKEPEITTEERLDRYKKVVFGKQINQRGYVQFSKENQKLNKTAGVSTKIDINEKYKRVEMYKQGAFGYRVIEVQFDDIVKDKDGNLCFHDNGEPVIKRYFEFIPSHYEIEKWFKKFLW